jgi:glucokinase
MWLAAFVAELRAASLRILPTGGLYLAGGVSTKLMPRLGEFIAAEFANEPANAAILSTVPVLLVDDSADVGLLGAR